MRLLYAFALAALVSAPALAQTQYADSSGGFVVLHSLSFGQSGASVQRAIDAGVGYRFASGVDASLRVARRSSGFGSATALGPTVGMTRPLGAGFTGRLEGSVLASRTSASYRGYGDVVSGQPVDVQVRSLRADLTASVSRPVRLVGSLRLHPTLGVFARTGTERVTFDGEPADRAEPFPEARTGLHVALPLSFRLFGQTASVEAATRFAVGHGFQFEVPGDGSFSPGGGAYAGGGLRLNF